MSAASCPRFLYPRPSLFFSPVSTVRGLKLSVIVFPLNQSSWVVDFLSNSSKNKWRFLCFRHEGSHMKIPESKSMEDKIPKHELHQPHGVKRSLISDHRKVLPLKRLQMWFSAQNLGLYHGQQRPFCRLCSS